MRRGEVWWADLPRPRASEPGYRRPVVIVQADTFNRSGLGTVVVAAVSANLRLGAAPGNVTLSRRASHLDRESVVNVSQLLALDRAFLAQRVGQLAPATMTDIDAGLKLVLGL